MNLNDKEIYSDLNEPEEKKVILPIQTQFSTSISTPFTTPRVNELNEYQKNASLLNSQRSNFKNLSFISNDSNNSSCLNSNENQQFNGSRRNTNENLYTQDYSGFFNDWRNMRYYKGQVPERKESYGLERKNLCEFKSFDIDFNIVNKNSLRLFRKEKKIRLKKMGEPLL